VNRSLTIQAKTGSLPWRAHPSDDTTVGELEAAISMFQLDILRTTDDEILLVQTDQAIRNDAEPPAMEALGRAMFGPDHNAILVTETGRFSRREIEESFDEEAQDRNAEGA